MSRHINELAEIVLGHVYKLGWQHRSEIEEGCKVADELVAAERKLRETEQELDRLRQRHVEVQSEEVAAARAEIETLRQQLANAQQELSEQGLAHSVEGWQEAAELRQQLADAQREAVNLQKLHDHLRPRLDAAQGQLTRERLNADEQGREIETLRQQLANAQQEASDEFAERQVLQHEASDDYVELERLRAFVEVMRGLLTEEYADQRIIAEALDELDAGTPEPVPVAEPLDPDTRDQELERLYSAIDGDLLAEGISHVCREIGEARKHGADSEPSPVAEPLDAEGGA
jgi:chromosome segregation ATPase